MLSFHIKNFLKNVWFIVMILIFSLILLAVSIYFLYLKINLQLNETIKKFSLIILAFPNFLIYLGWMHYWNIVNKKFVLNNQYYIFNLTNKNLVKFNFKNSLIYYLITLPYTLIFVIIELIVYSSIQNFWYSFIYYFVLYWIYIFLILKFSFFLSKKSKNIKFDFFHLFPLILLFVLAVPFFLILYYSNLTLNQTQNTLLIIFYFLLIFNPNLYSVIFLNNAYNDFSILAIVICSLIVILVLFIVNLRDWIIDKKLFKLKDFSKLLVSLNAKNISYSKNKIILNNISFSIFQNERISLLGNNGSGKTTLIKVITRSLLNKKIKLFWSCPNILISGVFQEFNFNDNFKCYEVIKYYSHLYNHRFTEEEILRLFKEFDLKKYYNHYYKSLSYGTKQKIKIIFALMNKPDLLILDEPFLGVDLEWKKLCWKKLNEFLQNKTNTALIFVSHNLNDHKLLTNKYFLIQNGTIKKINGVEDYLNANKKDNKKIRI